MTKAELLDAIDTYEEFVRQGVPERKAMYLTHWEHGTISIHALDAELSRRYYMHLAERGLEDADEYHSPLDRAPHESEKHYLLRGVAEHILAMTDDAYLTHHPEWEDIVAEARIALELSASDEGG
jgi:hypothetical protein